MIGVLTVLICGVAAFRIGGRHASDDWKRDAIWLSAVYVAGVLVGVAVVADVMGSALP